LTNTSGDDLALSLYVSLSKVVAPGDCPSLPLRGEILMSAPSLFLGSSLSGLERPSTRWQSDPEGARDALSAAVSLMKQARAFAVGVVVATQNPMDLDHRALGNVGLWCVGRLQTDADRERVLDGMTSNGPDLSMKTSELHNVVKRLASRWFVMRNVHAQPGLSFLQPRWAMSYLRGPMTRNEIRMAREMASPVAFSATSTTPAVAAAT
jgi:hypothetical protein